MSKVFIIPFHVRPIGNSIMPHGYTAAYVRCYASGSSYVEAVEKSLAKLSTDGLYPEEILQPIQEMDSKDWTMHINDMWPEHVDSLVDQASFEDIIERKGVVYGSFGAY